MQERSAVEQIRKRKARETSPSELKARQIHAHRGENKEDDREDQEEEIHVCVSCVGEMADGVGFEPTVTREPRQFSRLLP